MVLRERKIKVLIVDDSSVYRMILAKGLSSDPSIEVVGTASDPYEAAACMQRLNPDVMTCDVEMPRMNGVEFIRKLLPQHPMPVIVVSTISHAVLDALGAGAVDFVTKPSLHALDDVERFMMHMIQKVKVAASSTIPRIQARQMDWPRDKHASYGKEDDLIVIGASTGGIEAIQTLLKSLPAQLPGIVVVQHIPSGFSRMFSERMNTITAFQVKEAQTGDVLKRGSVFVAPGNRHVRVRRSAGQYVLKCDEGDKVNGHRPSVDVLFESAAQHAGPRVIGILLTGMGYDGARGMLAIRRKGGRTIGQDAETSAIYGMPKAAYELGAVDYQLPLHAIGPKLCALLGRTD